MGWLILIHGLMPIFALDHIFIGYRGTFEWQLIMAVFSKVSLPVIEYFIMDGEGDSGQC